MKLLHKPKKFTSDEKLPRLVAAGSELFPLPAAVEPSFIELSIRRISSFDLDGLTSSLREGAQDLRILLSSEMKDNASVDNTRLITTRIDIFPQ